MRRAFAQLGAISLALGQQHRPQRFDVVRKRGIDAHTGIALPPSARATKMPPPSRLVALSSRVRPRRLSSMIRAFSDADQRRRRSGPGSTVTLDTDGPTDLPVSGHASHDAYIPSRRPAPEAYLKSVACSAVA